jgi:hypothetical protein
MRNTPKAKAGNTAETMQNARYSLTEEFIGSSVTAL